jgi:hypothetical protein
MPRNRQKHSDQIPAIARTTLPPLPSLQAPMHVIETKPVKRPAPPQPPAKLKRSGAGI